MRVVTNGTLGPVQNARRRIIKADMYAGAEGNVICQPALIKVPAWVGSPLGTYYLYWATHLQGDASNAVGFQRIKLAYTNAASITASLASPWTVHTAGTLTLAAVEAFGPYAHSTSLAHVGFCSIEDTGALLKMWTHANATTLGHSTVYATSTDGSAWTVVNGNVGATDGIYLAVFKHSGTYYAVEESGALRRSADADGKTNYTRQADIETFRAALLAGFTTENIRHVGVEVIGNTLHVYCTVRGDIPERVYYATCDLSVPDWEDWACVSRVELFRPEYDFEGAFYTQDASAGGPAAAFEHEIRDPYPFTDPADGSRWLVYAAAGEHGIGIAQLS
jgi:hypothetical protein